MTTAAAAASAVIEEAGLGASRAVQVAGYALAVASLLVCSFPLWHLGRRLLNRLAHMSHGNTTLIQLVDSEAIYKIAGSRSGKTHLHRSLWVQGIPDRRRLRTCRCSVGCGQGSRCVAPPRRRAAHRPPRRRVLTRCFRGPLSAVAMRFATLPIRARASRVSRQSQGYH